MVTIATPQPDHGRRSASPKRLRAVRPALADPATASPNPHSKRDIPDASTPPRFPPLEAFGRRPSAASQPSRQGRHPKPFTRADIGSKPGRGHSLRDTEKDRSRRHKQLLRSPSLIVCDWDLKSDRAFIRKIEAEISGDRENGHTVADASEGQLLRLGVHPLQ